MFQTTALCVARRGGCTNSFRCPPIRASPLWAVAALPRRSQREFTTTAAAAFAAGRAGAPVRAVRFGMVTEASLNEAAYSLGSESAAGRPTSSSRAGPDALGSSSAGGGGFTGTSEAREAAMRGTGISEAAAKASAASTRVLLQSPLAPAAGGPGSLMLDRGRKVAGITGEVYRRSDDPKLSTAAQRTWLPAHDPGVKAMLHPPTQKVTDTSFLSLPIHGHVAATVQRAYAGAPHGRHSAYAAAPVVVTDVTVKHGAASRVHGGSTQVWADER